MTQAIEGLSNIALKRGTRVIGIHQGNPSHVLVDVANGGGDTMTYRCRLLVAADGTSSRLARLAGIAVQNRPISTIVGYRLSIKNLPEAEFGHVFLGAKTPVLLYPIGSGQARILFDLPYQPGRRSTVEDCLSLSQMLPPTLRSEVEMAIATQPRMSLLTQAIKTDRSTAGRVALVGDAGGCCHPLTATGMTMCISDALMLESALRKHSDDIPAALRLYERRRRWPQTTRLAMAEALRDALSGSSAELQILRDGIFRHLRGSAKRRSATIALLSTADNRPLALLRQIMSVTLRGFAAHLKNPKSQDRAVSTISVAKTLTANLIGQLRGLLLRPSIDPRLGNSFRAKTMRRVAANQARSRRTSA
jgi:2-polyprenyl-6-methoxyphenol hydroxylase-like FAD-dependent oxidoreductase